MIEKPWFTTTRWMLLTLALILNTGCSSPAPVMQNWVKSDLNRVADLHQQQSNRLLRTLTKKLYKRNPKELRKAGSEDINARIEQIFAVPDQVLFAELEGRHGADAIELCFEPGFQGDRVFALMVGLKGMLFSSYGAQTGFYWFDALDAQKLYNSARNLEIVAWRLANRRDEKGEYFLLSNSTHGRINLSFERLFGKLISTQDMMALVTEGHTERTIQKVIQRIATAVFLPVG